MRLVAPDGVGFVPLRGRLPFPEHSVTLIAKLKVALVPGGRAKPLTDEASLPTGDEPYPDAASDLSAPRYESDLVYSKPASDVLVVGQFHAPDGKPVRASEVAVTVGTHSVRLAVIGRRRWLGGGRLPSAAEAEPFTNLPLRWEHAYGGPGHRANPTGSGYVEPRGQARDFQREPLELPRIERPDRPLSFLDQILEPVCFAPRARIWPERRALLGTCDERWLKTRWPWFPQDCDMHYFQAALPALQRAPYLRGDERVRIENMHPSIADYHTQLPGLQIVAAVQRAGRDSQLVTEPVTMQLDTLWFDMEAEVAQLVWRGACVTRDADASDILHAWVGLEPLSAPLSPAEIATRAEQGIAAYEAQWDMEAAPAPVLPPPLPPVTAAELPPDPALIALLAALPAVEPLPAPSPEQQAEIDAATAQAAAELEARLRAEEEAEEEAKPAAWTRERVRTARVEPGALRGQDLSGLDLRGEDLAEVDLTGTLLKQAQLDGASLRKAILIGASLEGASLSDTDLEGAQLDDADLSVSHGARLRLSGARLVRANLAGCNWEALVLSDADLSFCHAKGAQWTGACLVRCKLDESDLESAVLSDARVEASSLVGAHLVQVQLARAQFADCPLTEADLSSAQLTEASLTRCNLDDALLEKSQAVGLVLQQCSVQRVRAEAADLRFAQWNELIGKDGIFESAQLSDARLYKCELPGADFSAALLTRASLRGTVLKHAKFGKADLRQAALLGCDCFEASFEAARLTPCDGTGSSFFRAEFLDAEVSGFAGKDRDLLGTKLAPAAR